MREGYGSRTAEQNALFRALESSRPEKRTHLRWPSCAVGAGPAIGGRASDTPSHRRL